GLTKMLCVDAIHRGEVTDVGEIHTDAHDIIETLARGLEYRRQILEDAVRLRRNPSRHHLARRWVLADLTAQIDETARVNGLGKRTHRWREFRRGNCGLAHGKLLWTVTVSLLRQVLFGQRCGGRLGLHHDARYAPAASFFDRFDAVDAARG